MSEWIDVNKQGFPKVENWYLTTSIHDPECRQYVRWFDPRASDFMYPLGQSWITSHWMPLPKSPESA